ncbi:DUF5686 and carboxypeptidase-like regulatory domain-containing protein [Pedobacter sp. L105]|uniref:DUF5686 and carboxypeptidase-like regulatory domain-containing protein n=1 Tax=Pedobacter sp. L105 TaxID=1641871 RepID=UPI00131E8CF5|nr:DUF5686 and carboxypeptidase-like regulatory domain-containing protein [Pedobacter sp. L105]
MSLSFRNRKTKLASTGKLMYPLLDKAQLKKLSFLLLILAPFISAAQKVDSTAQVTTLVKGKVMDAVSGQSLASINISFSDNHIGTRSDAEGSFTLSAPGLFSRVTFSYVGYQSVTKIIKAGQVNELQIRLHGSQNQLKEVAISSGKLKKYKNKGNPAVELIQQVINHKEQNRMQNTDYLQYDLYERIGLSVFDMSPKLLNSHFFSKYKFMLDTASRINGQKQTSLPVYFNEKLSQNFYRKNPEKSIQVLHAEKGINIIKFIDTVGLDTYMNRLYGNSIDIYKNNIFIISNQFLSPISDHAPDFYKFFIQDTVKLGNEKLVEISFTPRNKGDLLFEGKLLVTLDGNYAVESCELNVNRQININFMRSLKVRQDFKKFPGGRYYLMKSDVAADFGVLKNKGMGVFGERTAVFSNYKLDSPLVADFYKGKSKQSLVGSSQTDTSYWAQHRTDTLTSQQAQVYAKVNRLQNMPSFKRTTWIASAITGGYANAGPIQIGQLGSSFSFNNQEGGRFQIGGRTTPKFNENIYLDGYAAYGTKDQKAKYDVSTYFSLNKTPPYRYPNDYFKVSYLYDVNLPGQTFAINNSQAALTSFHTGKTDYWLYNRIYSVAYVKDFENHFSYNIGIKNWNQQAAGTLVYQMNDADHTVIHDLTTSEVDLSLRYAPHEQIIQGTMLRHTIHSKYPIFNLQINHAFKGFLDGAYSYTNMSANIYKRFYFSQLGYADVTVLGNLISGKVPFPLLNISPANQSIAYDPNAYNQMDYLEFVSDHYVGFNFTQAFQGFFLNKIPLIEHLKWREYLSLKVLYGGLRNENNPLFSQGLYQFPTGSNGGNGTYSLGNTPYTEAGFGIGNIFKILRVDFIKRFNYLEHQGVNPYGVKLSFSPDF